MTEQTLRGLLDQDRFVQYAGITLEQVDEGVATARLQLQEHHLNGANIVQGGAIYTLADFALAAVANYSGRVTVTANATINYLRPANGSFIEAHARVVHQTNSLCFVEVEVVNDQNELVATFSGTGYRTKKTLE